MSNSVHKSDFKFMQMYYYDYYMSCCCVTNFNLKKIIKSTSVPQMESNHMKIGIHKSSESDFLRPLACISRPENRSLFT